MNQSLPKLIDYDHLNYCIEQAHVAKERKLCNIFGLIILCFIFFILWIKYKNKSR